MNKQILFLLFIGNLLFSCKEHKSNDKVSNVTNVEKNADTKILSKKSDNLTNSESYIMEKLPEWLLKSSVINQLVLIKNYKIENRLNPLYLEEDFNGDGNLDIILPIFDVKNNKKGFAIIHGKTFDIFILGAGKLFKNALGDDQDYIDIWTINRNKENEPSVEEETGNGENGILILENPSIEIAASEVGGGQIYWNGNEYAYFHQTC
jgi:hypothetical protein